MLKKLSLISAIAALIVGLGVAQAQAAVVINMRTGTAGPGGTIVHSGSNATGTDILLDAMGVLGSAADGLYDLSGGGSSTTAMGGTTALLNFDTAAGTISVIGGVAALGIADGTVLLSGTIKKFSVTAVGGVVISIMASGLDVKNEALLRALGVNPALPFKFLKFAAGVRQSGSTYVATNADIVNQQVPEPGSLLLLGTGLLGMAGAARRRLRAQKKA